MSMSLEEAMRLPSCFGDLEEAVFRLSRAVRAVGFDRAPEITLTFKTDGEAYTFVDSVQLDAIKHDRLREQDQIRQSTVGSSLEMILHGAVVRVTWAARCHAFANRPILRGAPTGQTDDH